MATLMVFFEQILEQNYMKYGGNINFLILLFEKTPRCSFLIYKNVVLLLLFL